MAGTELARRLRFSPQTANTVLIAITGYSAAQERELALAAALAPRFAEPVNVQARMAMLAMLAMLAPIGPRPSCGQPRPGDAGPSAP